jgi:cytochrome c peroxidase
VRSMAVLLMLYVSTTLVRVALGLSAQARFLLTQGSDPIFRTNDGSNCDHNLDTSTVEGQRAAYSLLLSRGLIRVALSPPANQRTESLRVR